MNTHLLALVAANAPKPSTTPLPVQPEPSLTARTAAEWADDRALVPPDLHALDLTEYAPPKPNRAQRRAAARRSAR